MTILIVGDPAPLAHGPTQDQQLAIRSIFRFAVGGSDLGCIYYQLDFNFNCPIDPHGRLVHRPDDRNRNCWPGSWRRFSSGQAAEDPDLGPAVHSCGICDRNLIAKRIVRF